MKKKKTFTSRKIGFQNRFRMDNSVLSQGKINPQYLVEGPLGDYWLKGSHSTLSIMPPPNTVSSE